MLMKTYYGVFFSFLALDANLQTSKGFVCIEVLQGASCSSAPDCIPHSEQEEEEEEANRY
jgi:hypothetical protein